MFAAAFSGFEVFEQGRLSYFWIEDWRADLVDAHGPFAEIDAATAVAAEGEILTGGFDQLFAGGAVERFQLGGGLFLGRHKSAITDLMVSRGEPGCQSSCCSWANRDEKMTIPDTGGGVFIFLPAGLWGRGRGTGFSQELTYAIDTQDVTSAEVLRISVLLRHFGAPHTIEPRGLGEERVSAHFHCALLGINSMQIGCRMEVIVL
jgi:hypothetical protein